MTSDTDHELEAAVLRVVGRIAPVSDQPVRPEAELVADLGFQSLAVAELGFALTDLFGVTVSPEAAFELRCVADVVGLVGTRVAAGTGRRPADAELAEWEAGYLAEDEELEFR